jgi:hypothetical protein
MMVLIAIPTNNSMRVKPNRRPLVGVPVTMNFSETDLSQMGAPSGVGCDPR